MVWRQTGDKPLSEPIMAQFTDPYMHHSASVSIFHAIASSAYQKKVKHFYFLENSTALALVQEQ